MVADCKSIIIYGVTLLISLVLCFIANKKDTSDIKVRIIWAIIIAMPLSILAGIRYGVGTDFFNYYDKFDEISKYSIWECIIHSNNWIRVEPLFAVISRILMYLKFDYNVILGVMELIMLTMFALTFLEKKREQNIVFSFFLMYLMTYHYSLNILRQCLALSFVVYGVGKLIDGKRKQFVLLVFIALGFHTIALVSLVFLIIPSLLQIQGKNLAINFKNLHLEYSFKFFVLLMLVLPMFMPHITRLFLRISFLQKYSHYFNHTSYLIFGNYVSILILLVPFIYLYKKNNYNRSILFQIERFTQLILFYIPLSSIGHGEGIGGRMQKVAEIVLVLAVPQVCEMEKNKKTKMIIYLYYLLLFSIEFSRQFLIGTTGETFPFNTIWSK